MLTVTPPQAQQDYFSLDVSPQPTATNSVRQTQRNGLVAQWVRVNGKFQCQWDMQ
ncbi:hypothetical protein [Leptolyngbya sp. FACHB-16]|uniref:hypothetical protein n=1 Tax=unclassified Leptolyngbya TaxID=2650499 RepID=UPI001687025D|nr:hypothetical protein [Leptolyngbya sp. FACHB-16]MBD2152914.1 hypothetical protein [Leptolyngbya sp. FACHB-16]